MIEASPSRCTPEQWTAEQAARAMGVVDEADGEATADGDGAGEAAVSKVGAVGRDEPNARGGGMRWVAGGTALAVVAAAAWWSGAGNRDSREIPVHAGADVALIAGERTPNSGPGDFNSSNESSHMKIQTTASAALLGAAAIAFQAQAGDAVQWRVEDGGNGHWYQPTNNSFVNFAAAQSYAQAQGGHLVTLTTAAENTFAANLSLGEYLLGGFQDITASDYNEPNGGWRWVTGEPWNFTAWNSPSNEPNNNHDNGNGGSSEQYLLWWRFGIPANDRWNDGFNNQTGRAWNCRAIIEWSADCNSDGIVDYGQCHDGTLPDYNGNNIPDCCEQGVQCTVGNYPVQWKVSDGGNGHWYQFIQTTTPRTWQSARDWAPSIGSHLATLTSAVEQSFIVSIAPDFQDESGGQAWLGGYQDRTAPDFSEPYGGWRWVTGQPVTYVGWVNSGDTPLAGADFLTLAKDFQGAFGWNAIPTDYAGGRKFCFVEFDSDCNNDNIVDYGQILNGQLPDTNTNNIPDCCEPGNNCCVGDIYVNHIIDGGDLGVLLSEWGAVTPTTNSDLNRDGFVNGADLGMLLANWGPCGG